MHLFCFLGYLGFGIKTKTCEGKNQSPGRHFLRCTLLLALVAALVSMARFSKDAGDVAVSASNRGRGEPAADGGHGFSFN